MSQTKLCRLCVKVCTDYASVYNETGQKNNICEIALKYFDPMVLSADQVFGSAALCLECCSHISAFYNFQKTVFKAQSRLLEGEREIGFEIKKEMSEEIILDNKDNSHVTVKQEDSISLPDLEWAEEFIFADNLQNEDIQVAPQTVNEPIQECENAEEFDIKDDKIIINNSDTKQSEDHPLSIFDTSESEKGSDSDDNQSTMTTTIKRKRKQRSASKDLDAVIAQWKPNLECVVCKKSLPNFKSLSDHFRLEHPIERCRVECCRRRFYTRYTVAKHARLHFNPDKVKCNQCDSYYSSTSVMYVHMSLVHSTANIETSDKIGISKLRSKSSIECVICKTSCTKFYLLKKHYRLEHPTEVCYALCCERKFNRGYVFEEHMRLHRDPNAFKCEICGKPLCTSRVLKTHMRRWHSNIKTADP